MKRTFRRKVGSGYLVPVTESKFTQNVSRKIFTRVPRSINSILLTWQPPPSWNVITLWMNIIYHDFPLKIFYCLRHCCPRSLFTHFYLAFGFISCWLKIFLFNFSVFFQQTIVYESIGLMNSTISNFTNFSTTVPMENKSCPWTCELTNDAGYVVYSAFGSFYIPMFVMLFFYWRIYRAAVRTTRAINQGFRTTKGKCIVERVLRT